MDKLKILLIFDVFKRERERDSNIPNLLFSFLNKTRQKTRLEYNFTQFRSSAFSYFLPKQKAHKHTLHNFILFIILDFGNNDRDENEDETRMKNDENENMNCRKSLTLTNLIKIIGSFQI